MICDWPTRCFIGTKHGKKWIVATRATERRLDVASKAGSDGLLILLKDVIGERYSRAE